MDIDDTCDCVAYARAWAHHASFSYRMRDQADTMEAICNIIRDPSKALRWRKCVRFLRYVADMSPARVHSITLAEAADIGWGLRL